MPALQIDENVYREIINHRSLRHPNIIRFKEVCLFVLVMGQLVLLLFLFLNILVAFFTSHKLLGVYGAESLRMKFFFCCK